MAGDAAISVCQIQLIQYGVLARGGIAQWMTVGDILKRDESGPAAGVTDPVLVAEELVSSVWLTHLAYAEQRWLAGERACRHMRDTAEASLRAAMISGDLPGIVAAQAELETARADEAACRSSLRGVQELLDQELALRGESR